MTVTLSHRTALGVYFDNPRLGLLSRRALSVSKYVGMREASTLPDQVLMRESIDILVGCAALRGPVSTVLHYHVLPSGCPEDSFIELGDYALVSPELCYLQLAAELDVVDLVLLGFRLCGDYRSSEQRFAVGNLPLTTPERLLSYIERCSGCKGAKKARCALKYVIAGSNSTMESRLTIALIFPRKWGGYGLLRPMLNEEVPGTERCGDLCWPDKHVIVEYDSLEHHADPSAQERDSARRAQIGLQGYLVITVSRLQVSDPRLFDETARYIARELGCRTSSRSRNCSDNRKKLLRRLFREFNETELFTGR